MTVTVGLTGSITKTVSVSPAGLVKVVVVAAETEPNSVTVTVGLTGSITKTVSVPPSESVSV